MTQHFSRAQILLRTIFSIAMPPPLPDSARDNHEHRPLMIWIVGGLIAAAVFAAFASW